MRDCRDVCRREEAICSIDCVGRDRRIIVCRRMGAFSSGYKCGDYNALHDSVLAAARARSVVETVVDSAVDMQCTAYFCTN